MGSGAPASSGDGRPHGVREGRGLGGLAGSPRPREHT